MKVNDISPGDKAELLEDIRFNLIIKGRTKLYIDELVADLGSVFFLPQETKNIGLRALSETEQDGLEQFLREQKPGKNILSTLLILWYIENNTTGGIIITQKLIEEMYQKCGLQGNIYQQLKDYGAKGKYYFIREEENGTYKLTEAGRDYIISLLKRDPSIF